MSIKVFIADDHPLILQGIEQLLSRNGDEIELLGSFEDGASLLQQLPWQQPDVILLDIQMPGRDGYNLCKFISDNYPDVPILALTNNEHIESVRHIISLGARGYLLKTSPPSMLIEAIKTVSRNQEFIDPALHTRLVNFSLRSNMPVAIKLTRREKEILQLMATNHTSKDIAEKLFLSKRTVDNHRFNLLAKLDVKNAPALVKKAIELGLLNDV
jgi:DNA-binding NarL/FixJ family response regulator